MKKIADKGYEEAVGKRFEEGGKLASVEHYTLREDEKTKRREDEKTKRRDKAPQHNVTEYLNISIITKKLKSV